MNASDSAPLLTVLVPIYNVERYLAQCLDSLAAQTLTDLEIICINDGSTDASRAIIETYLDDPRFRVIDKPNSGYGASMNRGLAEARGTYVGILESDDFIAPHAFETLVKTAEAHDAEVVKATFDFYWSTPEERRETYQFYAPLPANTPINPQEDDRIFYEKPSIWSAIYRRDFLEKNAITFLETPGASYQDAAFNFKVWASATRIVYVDEAFLSYRQDNEQSSVNSPSKVYCVCDEYDEMFRFIIPKDPETQKRLRAILVRMKYDTYMWNLDRLSLPLGSEFVYRAADEFRGHITDEDSLAFMEPWKLERMRTLIANPLLFYAQYTCQDAWSFAQKLRHYLKLGGPRLLAQALLWRTQN